ncbi:hypothetical protein MAR_010993 [Mya arenaria]|uniref:Uncharacterized protein n=1 Tax=Mya arenaria TaxID=6604 RepID=A0ABY7FVH1_MYAAR|nr:hypothetical protein MAR_010993 [Mya arenaria]
MAEYRCVMPEFDGEANDGDHKNDAAEGAAGDDESIEVGGGCRSLVGVGRQRFHPHRPKVILSVPHCALV